MSGKRLLSVVVPCYNEELCVEAFHAAVSAVMLCGESAAGKCPGRTGQTMAEIVEGTETHIDYEP